MILIKLKRPRGVSQSMVFEHIEKLKLEYTDKFVVVDERRPELRRFKGQTGTVRTVNMNGRALVEFDAYDNIGWYDIEIDYLKVIDQPLPKKESAQETKSAPKKQTAKKKPAKEKPVQDKEPSALEKARASDGKQTAANMSVDDVLAAARKNTAAEDAAPAAQEPAAIKDPASMSVADILAAARGNQPSGATQAQVATPAEADNEAALDVARAMEAARKPKAGGAPPAAAAPGKDPRAMSVAEILAAARGDGGATDTAAASVPQAAEPDAVEPDATTAESTPAPAGPLPTTTADIVAYLRQQDG